MKEQGSRTLSGSCSKPLRMESKRKGCGKNPQPVFTAFDKPFRFPRRLLFFLCRSPGSRVYVQAPSRFPNGSCLRSSLTVAGPRRTWTGFPLSRIAAEHRIYSITIYSVSLPRTACKDSRKKTPGGRPPGVACSLRLRTEEPSPYPHYLPALAL